MIEEAIWLYNLGSSTNDLLGFKKQNDDKNKDVEMPHPLSIQGMLLDYNHWE
jgi:hypothetical protein